MVRLQNRLRLIVKANLFLEVGALAIIVLATLVVLGHLASTNWLKVFLFDGDSLTLPILRKSLEHHEAIQWVFSSQLNLFPEAILYGLACLGTSNVGVSLVINGVLNIVSFYLVLRVAVGSITKTDRRQRIAWSVICSLALLLLMLIEDPQRPIINQSYAVYFLFNTYYSGTLLVGALNVALVMRFLANGYSRVWAIVIAALTAVTVASNPIYALQFAAPICLALGLLTLCKLVNLRQGLQLVGLQIGSVGLGLLLRLSIKRFIGQSLGSHLASGLSRQGLESSGFNIINIFIPNNIGTSTKVSILIVIIMYFACLLGVLIVLNRTLKYRLTVTSRPSLFLLLFTALMPLLIGAVLVLGDDVTQRYFIASTVMLFMALLVPLAQHRLSIVRRPMLGCMCLLFVVLAPFELGHVRAFATAANPDVACLQKSLNNRPANGVGGYFLARFLDVYNTSNIRVLQVRDGYYVYPWLNNLATYQHKTFNFVVEESDANSGQSDNREALAAHGADSLGTASYVRQCPNFRLYYYRDNTPGYQLLNQKMTSSLRQAERYRQQGDSTKYNGFTK